MQLESFLQRSAERFPDKTALVSGPRRMTYAEYDAASNRLAHALIACGVSRGDRVAIMLDNRDSVVPQCRRTVINAAASPTKAT